VLAHWIGRESDVEQEGLELSSGEERSCAEAVASADALGRRARTLDLEREEVVGFERGGIDQRVVQLPLRCLPVDVDVARRLGAIRECQVKREPALEQPAVGRGLNQTSERSRSNATRLRSRARRAPSPAARVRIRCSRVWRNAAASPYLTLRFLREGGR
jgi:hypothetical protein